MLHTQWVFIFLCILIKINAVPPEACFAKFRWEDCGRPPKRVVYYWKPGSRCEVGIWKGCLPNINMFHDEYECVSTCIFNARAQPSDYHAFLEKEEEVDDNADIIDGVNVTSSTTDFTESADATEGAEATTTVEANATTVVVATNATEEVENNGTVAEGKGEPDEIVEKDNESATNSTS